MSLRRLFRLGCGSLDEAHVWGMSGVTLIILMNHYSCRNISDEDVDEPQPT